MSLTLSARNTVLPSLFSGTVYIALHTGNPGDTGAANEVTDASYARKPATLTIDTSTGTASLAAGISFTIGGTVTLTHISMWSAATGGTCSNRQPLASPVQVTGTFTIAAGDITVGGPS